MRKFLFFVAIVGALVFAAGRPLVVAAGSVDAYWKGGLTPFDLAGDGRRALLNQLYSFNIATRSCVSLAQSTPLSDGVYYIGDDGRRHAFVDDRVYASWYTDRSQVREIAASQLASIPLGETITYKTGPRLIKFEVDPKVYAVDANGWLRWIKTPSVAAELFGSAWQQRVDVVSDAFFINYVFGTDISTPSDYTPV